MGKILNTPRKGFISHERAQRAQRWGTKKLQVAGQRRTNSCRLQVEEQTVAGCRLQVELILAVDKKSSRRPFEGAEECDSAESSQACETPGRERNPLEKNPLGK